jgi:hypothetical protein
VACRIYIPSSSSCLSAVLDMAHDVAHEGVVQSLHRL